MLYTSGSIPKWKLFRNLKQKSRLTKLSKKKKYDLSKTNTNFAAPWEKDKKLNPRHKFILNYYGKIEFNGKAKTVKVEKDLGIEKDREYFFKISQEILSGYPSEVIVDLNECPRIWPSGIMLLCSQSHWIKLKSLKNAGIVANSKLGTETSKYINYCGLKKYFENTEDPASINAFNSDLTVKLMRETSKYRYDDRINEIHDLVSKYSFLDSKKLKRFKDVILNELFINISEHGVNYRDVGYEDDDDLGWYVIAQAHISNKFISICVADNGIGIKNSLLTGPLSTHIKKLVSAGININTSDGDFMNTALEANISGAFDTNEAQTTMKDLIWYSKKIKRFKKGRNRGMGFTRIKNSCPKIGIEVNILSKKGFLSIDSSGKVFHSSFKSDIFQGTLFNIIIPIINGDQIEN